MFRILVSDPDLLQSMERERWFLHPARYAVLRAPTGADAIAHARRSRPDVAVVAQGLADTPGLNLVQQLRTLPGCGEVPAILTVDPASALDPKFRQRATGNGVQTLLARPVGREDLFGAVRRVAMPTGAPTVRVPVSATATLATEQGEISGQVLNLSRGGVYVATDEVLPTGAKVKVALTLPRFMNPITLSGQVKWSNPAGPGGVGSADGTLPPGIGVEFTDLPKLTQSTLNLFILSSPRAVQL
jgi:type IV pilus assembly protein PilZ